MDEKAKRREAAKAYKETMEVGGLYRIVHKGRGWRGPLCATPNLAGIRNRFLFGVKTGACFDKSMEGVWKEFGGDGFAFAEVERLERKPEMTPGEFREELSALLALWEEKEA